MRGGIIGRGHLISGFGDDGVVSCDNSAEGTSLSGTDIVDRQLNGARHQGLVHFDCPI
jgi:hypothetical protein